MKMLLINKTLYRSGGDAVCTMAEGDLLSAHGHEVRYWGMQHERNGPHPYQEHFAPNVELTAKMPIGRKVRTLANLIYSMPARRGLERVLDDFRPDIVHVNNIHHHLSPSVLDAIHQRGYPMVMTLHDYKVVCPYYDLRRPDGTICYKCRHHRFYNCALHRCTKGSLSQSLVNTVEMYIHHALLRAYDHVDLFLSPSGFLREKVREMGFRKEVLHLPHFIDASQYPAGPRQPGRRVVCFGRLGPEKGLMTLLEAADGLALEVRLVGEGPIRRQLAERIARKGLTNVVLAGFKSGQELHDEIRGAMATVIPSEWHENSPRAIIESFALGRAVIASRMGGMTELIHDGQTGWLFPAGDVAALRDRLRRVERCGEQTAAMGRAARSYVEAHHGPDGHCRGLLAVYERVRADRSGDNDKGT